ncbi:hypothetical protein BJ138DRAFT_974978, partial [Hygrophoropsis aurantiaca]
TEAELRNWEPANNACCTRRDFRIDITGYKMSPWNKSAAQVFAKAFLKKYDGFGRTHDQVVHAWLSHVDSLRKRYKRELRSKDQAAKAASQHRRSERKANLYIRRLETAGQYHETKGFVASMVEQLGRDGMSSDESDHGSRGSEAVYVISSKEWRSNAVTDWLRTLDALHIRLRYNGTWQASQGAWPHCRTPSLRKISSKREVKALPRDFYSSNWLKSRTKFRRNELHV